jgi:hypothetical protein
LKEWVLHQPNILGDIILSLNVSYSTILAAIHLQWPQIISLWHRNPNSEIIRTGEGITWSNTVDAISSSRSIGDELNWANIWSSC